MIRLLGDAMFVLFVIFLGKQNQFWSHHSVCYAMFNISAQTLLQNAISEIGIFSDRKFKLLEWILALGQDDACVMLMFFRNIRWFVRPCPPCPTYHPKVSPKCNFRNLHFVLIKKSKAFGMDSGFFGRRAFLKRCWNLRYGLSFAISPTIEKDWALSGNLFFFNGGLNRKQMAIP